MSLILQQLLVWARRYPIAVISLSLIVVLGLADYYFRERRDALTVSFELKRQEGEKMLSSLNSHARILTQTAAIQEALDYIGKNLAVESDLAGNLDYFYQLEKSTKIRLGGLNQLNSLPSDADKSYRAIPFTLRLTGSYPQILAYLHELETGPRLLRVKQYRFSQVDATAVDGLDLDLTVELLGSP